MPTRAIAPATAPRLRLIGEAAWTDATGRVLALEPKDALLLAYVALVGPTPRRALAALLWPDVEPARAHGNLRQRLYRLRKTVGVELLQGGAVASLAVGIEADLPESDRGVDAGELLTGVTAADAGALAEWLAGARDGRRARRIETLGRTASDQEAAGQLASALTSARELVEVDPTSEHAHRRLMRLHYLRGDRAAALAAFDRCCDVLEQQLGVAPDAETEALRRHVEAADRLPLTGLPRPQAQPLPVSVLRPPRLIGRADELGVLLDTWQASGLATVIGEAGLGKTRLLETLVDARPDAVCTAARPGDSAVPFTTLARLLRAVLQRAEAGAAPPLPIALRREVACVLPEWGEPVPGHGDGRGLAFQVAVRSLLAGAPGLRGLVIDDLHFADPASLQILQSLVDTGEVARAGLSWVLAYRPAETGSPLSAFQDALLDVAVPARVILAPLDAGQIVQWVDALELPGVRGAEVAALLLRRTGGNPLFMLETVKQVWLDGALPAFAAGSALARPQTVQQLIERRLSQLSDQALMLARVAAVAAPDFGIELAQGVLGQAAAMQLASAWSELEAAQVLRDGGFAHDLVYEATLASVPREIARHTHAAVARWLAGHAGEPARIAAHWLAAGDDASAIAPLREAARRSTARTLVAQARHFLQQAAELCAAAGRDTDEFGVLMELHLNYIVDDPGVVHERLVQRLAAVASNPTERLDAAWARHNLRRFRQSTSPIDELQSDVVAAEQLGDDRVLAALVMQLVSGHLTLGRPDDAAAVFAVRSALFERCVSRTDLADFVGNLADLLGEQDRFDESLPHLARAAELYREAQEPAEVMVAMCNRTRHLRQQGRVVAAQEVFDQIDRWHAANAPNPRAWLVSRAGASEVLRELGRYRESMQAMMQPMDKIHQHMGRLYPAFPLAQVRLWLALGQHARARQSIDEMGDLSAVPDWLQARCRLAEAQVAARIHGAGETDRPSAADWQTLDLAAQLAPRQLRRSAWFECELQRAVWLDASAGAALAEAIDAVATLHGMVGYAQQAKLCAAARRLEAGHHALALQHVRAVQIGEQHRFADATSAEPVHPCGGSIAGRDLVVSRVLLATRQPDAARYTLAAKQRLTAALDDHVPAEFQASVRQRNPVHRELLSLVCEP